MRATFRVIGLLPLAASIASAQSGAKSATSSPVDLGTARKDLTALRTAEEVYFTNNNTYTPILTALQMTVSEGVTIRFVETAKDHYAVSATLAGQKGVSCVMYIGNVSAIPKTEQGSQAKSEGGILCDGDPEPGPSE